MQLIDLTYDKEGKLLEKCYLGKLFQDSKFIKFSFGPQGNAKKVNFTLYISAVTLPHQAIIKKFN